MAVTGLPGVRIAPVVAAFERTSEVIGASEIRLGTGIRITRAGEDAGSVSLATQLQSANATLRSARQNGAHATTLAQIAADGLARIREILDSIKTDSTTANDGGTTDIERATLDARLQSALVNINSIATTTRYKGTELLDGSFSATVSLSNGTGGSISLAIPDVTRASLFPTAISFASASEAATAAPAVATASQALDVAIAKVDAYQQQLASADRVTSSNIYGHTLGIDELIGTVETENADLSRNLLRQVTAAGLIAQSQRLNAGLLGLVG